MCEYCAKLENEPIAKTNKGELVIEYGKLIAADFGAELASANINFCPMCGRRLGKPITQACDLEVFRVVQGDTGGAGAPSYKVDLYGRRVGEWNDWIECCFAAEVNLVLAMKNREIAELKRRLTEKEVK